VLVPFFNQTFEYVLAAKGYAGLGQPDGLTRSATATAKVQLSGLTATPSSTVFGTPTVVTLRWESYGARGFQLSGHPDLPIGTSAVTVMQTTTGNYTLTALGDTLGDPLPTLSIDVPANPKGKDKEKEKEKDKEKEHKEKDHKEGSKEKRPPQSEELQFTAFRANIPAELRGTQRAFIGEELRPEPATEQPSGN